MECRRQKEEREEGGFMLTERTQYMSGSSCLPFQIWEVSKYFYPHSHVTARETVLETK